MSERASNVVLTERTSWHEQAACRGLGPGMFYPEEERADYDTARQFCASCPVIESCAATGAHEGHGIWGGTTPNQRHSRHRVA